MLRRYVHGDGADTPLVWYEGAQVASPQYLYTDHQGSIVARTDSTGAVTSINTYDEYGIPGSANTGRFQYTGQAWLPELGMYHYKARIYSPTLGRFLQTDPIGYEDQVNLYAYVGNDPVNRTDPTGMQDAAPQQTSCNAYGCFVPASPETKAAQEEFKAYVEQEVRPEVDRQLATGAAVIVGTGATAGTATYYGGVAVGAVISRGASAAEANAAALARAAARPASAPTPPPTQIVRPTGTGSTPAGPAVPGSGPAPSARNLAGELLRATGELVEANQPLLKPLAKTLLDWIF